MSDFFPPPPDTMARLAAALRGLEGRSGVDDNSVYDLVTSFVAPLPELRKAVRDWEASLPLNSATRDVAESVALVLCPACVADSVKGTRARRQPMLPEVPAWRELASLPRILSAEPAHFKLQPPPTPLFRYPFDSPVPIPAAEATAQWILTATETLGKACAATAVQPVALRASTEAQQVLGPAWGWFSGSGFVCSRGSWTSATCIT